VAGGQHSSRREETTRKAVVVKVGRRKAGFEKDTEKWLMGKALTRGELSENPCLWGCGLRVADGPIGVNVAHDA